MQVNIAQFKINPSKYAKLAQKIGPIEICLRSKPIAVLTSIQSHKPTPKAPKLGLAKGKYQLPDNFNQTSEELIDLFYGE